MARPRSVTPEQLEMIRRLRAEGKGSKAIAKAVGLSDTTVRRALKQYLREESGDKPAEPAADSGGAPNPAVESADAETTLEREVASRPEPVPDDPEPVREPESAPPPKSMAWGLAAAAAGAVLGLVMLFVMGSRNQGGGMVEWP